MTKSAKKKSLPAKKRSPNTSPKRGCLHVKPTQKQAEQLREQAYRARAFQDFNRKYGFLPNAGHSLRLEAIIEISDNQECYPSHANFLWKDVINEGKEALNDYKERTMESIRKETEVLKERTADFKWIAGPHWLSDTRQGKGRIHAKLSFRETLMMGE